ncbi:MAG: histidine kinase [Burkholderiaceae bacterium]|nr:histidine kinase [Burkholderiaceae bacterium]
MGDEAGTERRSRAASGESRREEAAGPAADPGRRVTDGAQAGPLPDFCSSRIALRVFIVVNIAALLGAGLLATGLVETWWSLGRIILIVEPTLILSMVALCPVRRLLAGADLGLQWLAGVGIPALIAAMASAIVAPNLHPAMFVSEMAFWVAARAAFAAAVAAAIIEWLRLRTKALQPAQAEGRLQALQARIRPHFLFNSLNTVLGLMRSDVRQAERILENLSDLFRVFMRDSRELIPLDEEVLLCKEYLSIEQLRMAERLQVQWRIEDMPGNALLPSLLLQPLIENAVHHGIETRSTPGEIAIAIGTTGGLVRVDISNPVPELANERSGNQMALSNVRERLRLTFDVEGQLDTSVENGQFRVTVLFPYRKERRQRDGRSNFNSHR